MEIVLLLVRILLAGIFALAGVAKFIDLKGSEKAFQDFGVSKSLALPGAVALSVAEIGIAVLLLFVETSWFGAIAALGLLLLFIGQMIYQLARGNAPDCHCFGQLHSEPVSPISILRNILFAIPTAYLVFSGRAGQGMGFSDPRVDVMHLLFGVTIVSLLMAAIFYLRTISAKQDTILKQIEVMELVARDGGSVEREELSHPHEGLPIGAVVPDFAMQNLNGSTVSLADIRSDGLPVLYIFVSSTCSPCKSLVPEFEQWQKEMSDNVRFVFVSSGKLSDNADKFGGELSKHLIVEETRAFADLMKAKWTPTAILMDANGRVASHAAAGDTAIRTLVEQIRSEDLSREFAHFTNGHNHAGTNKVGEPVPEFSLADVAGTEITSEYFRDRKTLVAFWSLDCGYCDQMIEDLRSWDRTKGMDEPGLLVFSDGDAKANAELGLSSPIIVDAEDTATKLGMFGTPSAVLINENGVIVSETALGASDIWALIGKR
ncbi:MAG: TlpA family protein disulfide reductase [Acidobacteria bacterium]|nr:TlpA family protein disulfide reductase [Acidobacteriota bacterium]